MPLPSSRAAEFAPKKPRRTQKDLARMPDIVEEAFKPYGGVPHPIGIPRRTKEVKLEEAELEEYDGDIIEDEPEYDPAEISGPQAIPEPPRIDPTTEAHIQRLHEDIAKLHEGHHQVLQNLTHIVDTAARTRTYAPLRPPPTRGYAPLEAPPSRSSWLASAAKNAVSKIKGWWERVTGKTSAQEQTPTASDTSTWRTIEQAEQGLRDLPTMFLTGKTMDGQPLDREKLRPSTTALAAHIEALTKKPKSENQALEKRRNALLGDTALATQALAHSRPTTVELTDLEPEQEGDFLIVTSELRKRIHALQVLADTSRDRNKKQAAEHALRELQKITGGIGPEQKAKRAILICEAALKLPFANVNSLTRQRLSKDYQKRLTDLQNALQLQGRGKTALEHIYYDLAEDTDPEADLPLPKAA